METDELIERLLGDEELDSELEQRIRTASEGNPLFVEEMVAMVRESGDRDVAVPPTIKALLAARLDQLDPAERLVLERGSVEGQLFHSAAVQALATPPHRSSGSSSGSCARRWCARIARSSRSETRTASATYSSGDAAYDALPKTARADLHERFAAWLEERGPELVEHDEIVGYHLEQAYRYRVELGSADDGAAAIAVRAGVLLAAAGRAARNRADFPAAVRLLQRAADLDRGSRLWLLPDIAEVMFETGDLAEAAALLDEAIETARRAATRESRPSRRSGERHVAGHRGEGSTAEDVVELAERAASVLERLGDRSRLAAVLDIAGQERVLSRARAGGPRRACTGPRGGPGGRRRLPRARTRCSGASVRWASVLRL